jgi:terminase small subunit-like protein
LIFTLLKAKAHFQREQARKDQIPFSEALAVVICRRVSAGEFLINICKDPDMPTMRSVIEWKKYRSDFKALYDEAIRDRLDIFEDELVTIADDGSQDIKTITKGGKATKVLDGEVISRAKLRVDVRKAHLRAYRPERWAEQSTINLNSNGGDDPNNMTSEELERRIAELDEKDFTIKESQAA